MHESPIPLNYLGWSEWQLCSLGSLSYFLLMNWTRDAKLLSHLTLKLPFIWGADSVDSVLTCILHDLKVWALKSLLILFGIPKHLNGAMFH